MGIDQLQHRNLLALQSASAGIALPAAALGKAAKPRWIGLCATSCRAVRQRLQFVEIGAPFAGTAFGSSR